MSYAINAKGGLRAIDSRDDLLPGETYAVEMPQLVVDPVLEVSRKIQRILDDKAVELGYDNMLAALSYLNDPNPQFAADAQKLLEWRSDCWVETFAVINGEKKLKKGDVISNLPKFKVE